MNKKAIRIAAFMAVLTAAALRPASPLTEKLPIVPPMLSASAAETIASGECGALGDNVTWQLDADGTLTIQGYGEMADYESDAPWDIYRHNVTAVTIKSGVTNIGCFAFDYFNALKSIVIEDRLTNIGEYAFCECTALESITLPSTLTSIGDNAFSSCTSLKSITLPYSLTSIGYHAFDFCESLADVYIYNPEIVLNDFEEVTYGEMEGEFISYSEIFNRSTTIYGFAGSTAEEYAKSHDLRFIDLNIVASGECGALGDNVTWKLDINGTLTIQGTGDMCSGIAFPWSEYSRNVTDIIIQKGVTSIGECAFLDFTVLKSVTIPEGMKRIDKDAFYGCSSLTDITLPDSVTVVGQNAFYFCKALQNIRLSSGLNTINAYAFYGCQALKSITIPNSVTTIGSHAFDSCENLQTVLLSDNVTSIGEYAFHFCSSLKSINLPDSVTSIGRFAFWNCFALNHISMSGNVTNIGVRAFSNCYDLQSITLPNSVTSIDDYAFSDCTALKSISIPESVTSIGNSVFLFCENLKEVCIYNPNLLLNDLALESDTIIRGHSGSTAEEYAKSHGLEFVSLDAAIITQPVNTVVAKAGNNASVKVTAKGDGLTYTWYFKNKGASTFAKSSINTASYTVAMDDSRNGRQLYCVITDKYGNKVTSKTVTISIAVPVSITAQPVNTVVAKAGDNASVKVTAKGDGLTYTWYFKNKGASTFAKSSINTASYTVAMDDSRNGRQLYCVITDKYGNKVTSKTVTISIAAAK